MNSDWKIYTLGDVCEFYNGKAHEKIIDKNGKYIVVNSKFISTNGKVIKKTNYIISPLIKGDIVLVMSDVPNGKALAKCFLIDKNNTYSLNQRICAIRSSKFYNKFLFYQLNRNRYFLEFDNGENQTNLRKNEILNCPLFLPPLSEQKRIVKILDKAFAAIDKAISNTEKNLQNSKELFDSYLNKIFSNPGKDWEEKKIEDVCEELFAGGDAPKDKLSKEKTVQYNIPIFANAVKDNGLYGFTDIYRVLKPSLTIAARGSGTGHTEIRNGPFFPIVRLIVLTPNIELVNLEFLKYSIQNLEILRSGSAIPQLTVPMIKGYSILLPSLKEQLTIVKKLNTLSAETQKLIAIYQQKFKDLGELKKSILQKAFNGEL